MSFLLVVYLFLSDGTALTERYEAAGATMNDCIKAGQTNGKALWEKHKRDGDYSFMCIRKDVK